MHEKNYLRDTEEDSSFNTLAVDILVCFLTRTAHYAIDIPSGRVTVPTAVVLAFSATFQGFSTCIQE